MTSSDFLVIGGGVVGLSIARELKREFSDAAVTLIEKEPALGLHASGRNSGVLHAGFYYTPDSLKARFTKLGNRMLTDYCEARGIGLNKCGKLVVARDERDHAGLDVLFTRGRQNGIDVREVDEAEARSIEPRAKTYGRALYSPTTSSVNPRDVIDAMHRDAVNEGVQVELGVRFIARAAGGVLTSAGMRPAGYVVNAAGLYADRVGRAFGFSRHYRVLPFKGLYLYSDETRDPVRVHIYPVPDLRNPFLGVHFTVAFDGAVKIGPTAIPAFWRENYRALDNFRPTEFLDIVARQLRLLWSADFDFRRLAFKEMRKHARSVMTAEARHLAHGVEARHYRRWGKPGLRAQLIDIRTHRLEMDFVVEGDERSFHVLNAVSPAFTCSMPFAQHVCVQIRDKLRGQRREQEQAARGS